MACRERKPKLNHSYTQQSQQTSTVRHVCLIFPSSVCLSVCLRLSVCLSVYVCLFVCFASQSHQAHVPKEPVAPDVQERHGTVPAQTGHLPEGGLVQLRRDHQGEPREERRVCSKEEPQQHQQSRTEQQASGRGSASMFMRGVGRGTVGHGEKDVAQSRCDLRQKALVLCRQKRV